MRSKNFLLSLKDLLEQDGHFVSVIEMTSGNYDDDGLLIEEEVPTLTTEFCEIGIYKTICYFTIILDSNSFTERLFNLIKKIAGIQIYGFKNFKNNYYPGEDSSFTTLGKKIREEGYFQVQFDFDTKKLGPESIFEKYLELKTLFKETNAQIVNQMSQDLKKQ